MKIKINASSINRILKVVMQEHNFNRSVKPYNKKPSEITIDDIEQVNEVNRTLNNKLVEYKIGDVMKI